MSNDDIRITNLVITKPVPPASGSKRPRDDEKHSNPPNSDDDHTSAYQTGSPSRKRPRNVAPQPSSTRKPLEPEPKLHYVPDNENYVTQPTKSDHAPTTPSCKRPRPCDGERHHDSSEGETVSPSVQRSSSPSKKGPRNPANLNSPAQRVSEKELEPQAEPVSQSQPNGIQPRLRALLSFWLSPHNLSKDVHLIKSLTQDPDGWTPVSVFLSFNQIRALSAKQDDVICALRSLRALRIEFENEGINALADNSKNTAQSTTVRFRLRGGNQQLRKDVARVLADVEHRTVFVTHVPPQVDRDSVERGFGAFGKVVFVSLPRSENGVGRGFAFIEYATVHQAKRCIATISRALGSSRVHRAAIPTLPTVRAFPHAEWRRRQNFRKQRSAHSTGAQKQCSGPMREKKMVNNATENTATTGADHIMETEGVKGGGDERDRWTQGLVLHIRGLSKTAGGGHNAGSLNRTETISRRRLYEVFEEYGAVSFIEYSPKRKDECYVRFLHPSGASRALAALTGMDPGAPRAPRAPVLGTVVNAVLLAGLRERDYWNRVFAGRSEKAARKARRSKVKPV